MLSTRTIPSHVLNMLTNNKQDSVTALAPLRIKNFKRGGGGGGGDCGLLWTDNQRFHHSSLTFVNFCLGKPKLYSVQVRKFRIVQEKKQQCKLKQESYTCVGITEPSRKCRLILSRGAWSRSSSPLLCTESPWEAEDHMWSNTVSIPFTQFCS